MQYSFVGIWYSMQNHRMAKMTEWSFWPNTAVKKYCPVFPFKVACALRHLYFRFARDNRRFLVFLWINCAACTHVTSQWLRTEQDCLLRCVSEILQHGLFCQKHLFSRCRLTDKLRWSLFWVIKVWMCASHFWSLLNLTKTHQCYAYSLRFFPSRKVSWVCLEEMQSNYRYGNARLSC